MPTISIFYGIIISMLYEDNKQHNMPHIHARYQGDKAVFSLPEGELLAGKLPPRQTRMVQVWIDLRKEDLMANWELAKSGASTQNIFKIKPLD
jgi:hypothetical protein